MSLRTAPGETAALRRRNWRSRGLSLAYAADVGEDWSGSVRLGLNAARFDEADAAFAYARRALGPCRAHPSRRILSLRVAALARRFGPEHRRDTVIPHPHPSDTAPPVREALP